MGNRSGIALLLVLVMLLVLDLLVFGLITIATRERVIVDARVRRAELELRSDARLRWAQRHWPAVRRGGHNFLTIDTAAEGLFLIRPSEEQRGDAALVIRTLASRSLLAAFPAGITTDGPLMLGGGSVIDVSTARSFTCESDSIPLHTGPGIVWPYGWPLLLSGSRVDAQPAVVNAVPALPPALVDTLQGLADHEASGSVSFELIPDGQACDAAHLRVWGGQLQRVRLCSTDYPVVSVVDHLVVSGQLRGVMLVTGTLRLAAGAQFTGAILLAGGSLLAESGTRIRGAIRGSAARPILLSGAHLRFDPCAVWTALVSSDALNQPLPITRTWVPSF